MRIPPSRGISPALSAPPHLVKIGTGALDLSGSNTYTGGTTLKAGTLGITTDANIGGASSAISFQGGLLRLNGTSLTQLNSHTVNWSSFNGGFDIATSSHTFTVSQAISGTGSLTKDGAGSLVLSSAANTYTGGTFLKAGRLVISADSNVGGAASAITFQGGLLAISGTAITNLDSHTVNWSSFDGGFDVASSSNTFTVNQTIAGSGALTKAGTGTLVLNAPNAFTGDTTLSAGTLKLGHAMALANSAVNFAGGNVNLGALSSATFGGLKGTGAFDLNGKTFFVGANNQDTTYSGALSSSTGGSGAFNKVGTGVLTLTAAHAFAGPITIKNGIVSIASLPAAGSNSPIGLGSSAASLVLDGGTLRYTGGTTSTNRTFSIGANGGTLDGSGTGSNMTFTNTAAITMLGAGDRTFTLGGVFSDSNFAFSIGDPPAGGKTTLQKTEGGRWIINTGASLTYSGDTHLVNGTILFGGSSNPLPYGAGKGNLVLDTGTEIEMNGKSLNVNGLFGGGQINNRGSTIKTVTIGYADANGDFSGYFDNQGTQTLNVTKVGLGTQSFTGQSAYLGITTVSGGVLSISKIDDGGWSSAIGASSNAASNLVLDGGTLRGGGTSDRLFTVTSKSGTLDGATGFNFTSTGAIAMPAGGNRMLTLRGSSLANTLTPSLTDPSDGTTAIAKLDSGKWTLASASNGYSGGTNVSSGTLIVAGANALGNGTVAVANGATLALQPGMTTAVKTKPVSLTGSAVLDLADGAIVFDYSTTSPLATIESQISAGRNGGSWDGAGITSSVSAIDATHSGHRTAIGYAEASTLGVGSFLGQSLDGTAILARYTLEGDTNLDGVVDTIDFTRLASTFNETGMHWSDGDSNFDGAVNALDFNALASNFGNSLPDAALSATLGAQVPEPASAGLLLVAGLIASRRRRFSAE